MLHLQRGLSLLVPTFTAWQMATAADSLSGIETEALARAAVDTEWDFSLRLEELRRAGLDQQSATGAEQFYQAEQAQSRRSGPVEKITLKF